MPSLRRSLITVLLILLMVPAAAFAQGYQLVWSDEFDGTAVDPAKWTFELGDGCPSLCGWGNNELQYYRSSNATVAGGFLTITAKEESFGGRDYTSARMVTKNKADWTYGKFEMRAKLPIGRGLWPAFWLLFTNPTYGGWAASGEIDIMEYVGQNPEEAFGTIHYGGPFPANVWSGFDYFLPSGTFNDDFHTFALEWEPGEMRWFVDGNLYACQYDWYSTAGAYPAPFNHDFHLLLNCAVGGNLPGPPDGTTVFPQEFVVDYVRVYQKPEFEDCSRVFAGMDHADPFAHNWFTYSGIAGGGISGNTVDLPPVDGCVASLNAGWSSGGSPGFFGGFGRTNPMNLTGFTHFSFWIDPAGGQDYNFIVQLQDDDNGDGFIPPSPDGADDEFQFEVSVKPSGGDVVAGGGWQRVSIPLSSLYDDNSFHWGGNGVFDPFPTGGGGNGELINVVISLVSNSGADINFRTDRWEFTREEGALDGFVWEDIDGDGIRDGGEPGIAGITVNLKDDALNPAGSAVTGGSGQYTFPGLPSGEYSVEIDTTGVPTGAAPTGDPDGVATPHQAWVAGDCSGSTAGLDFGYRAAPVAVPDGPGPAAALLGAGVPNPFTSSTALSFSLVGYEPVSLTVFDTSGRRVRTLVDASLPAGDYEAVWNGRDDTGREAPVGMYFVRLQSRVATLTQRVVRLN